MGQKFYGGEIWGGGDDGSALVSSVRKNSQGQKFVNFTSLETNKKFRISKPHFAARFPVMLKGQ